jgi:hypothetical protein
MNRRYLVAATFLGIAACASSGPKSPEPAANVENAATNTDTTPVEGQLEVYDVPEVPFVANIPTREPEVICSKERRTGTHISKRVCRTQVQMKAEVEAAQETLDDLSRRTTGSGLESPR